MTREPRRGVLGVLAAHDQLGDGGAGGDFAKAASTPAAGYTARVLLAISDPLVAALLAQEAQEVGLVPTLAFNVKQVFTCLELERWDLLLIRVPFVGAEVLSFLRSIHECSDGAIVVLGSCGEPLDKVFATGVHEQFGEDTPPRELFTRALALLRLRVPDENVGMLRWGGLRVDVPKRQAHLGCEAIRLTAVQFRILTALVLAQGGVVTVRDLSRLLWGTTAGENGERIFAHIRRLRKKIEPDPSRPRLVVTVRSEGFRLADP